MVPPWGFLPTFLCSDTLLLYKYAPMLVESGFFFSTLLLYDLCSVLGLCYYPLSWGIPLLFTISIHPWVQLYITVDKIYYFLYRLFKQGHLKKKTCSAI